MTNKVNVLFTSLFGSLSGGGQKSLLYLLERLDQSKYHPILLCWEDGDLLKAAEAKGIQTHIKESPSLRNLNLLRIIKALSDYKKFILERNIHLIHTDSSRATFYLGLVAKKLKIPLISHIRVSTPEPHFYEKILYYLSTKIIAVSEYAKKRFERFSGSTQKVSVIYNAIDLKKFSPQNDGQPLRQKINVGSEILIGMVGEVVAFKGQEDFLHAASEVIKQAQNVKFVIIGDDADNYKRHLNDVIEKLSFQEFVTIMDFYDNSPEIMAALDILVNASSLEGFSRVIIEAMASGKAVVATEVGGNPEAVLDNVTGLLVPVKNSQKLGEAILRLVKNQEERNAFGTAGRKKVEELYSLDVQIKKIEQLYDQLLAPQQDNAYQTS